MRNHPPIANRVPLDPELARPPARSSFRRGCALTAAGLILLAGLLVAWLWLWPTPAQIERRWLEQAGFDPRETFPNREANATARRIEELVAPLGLEIAPPSAPNRARAPEDAAGRFESRRNAVRELVHGLRTPFPAIPELPIEVAAHLAESEPVLSEVVSLLEVAQPPLWDLAFDLETELPSLADHMGLHRLLIAGAAVAARNGDEKRALRWLDASARLRQSLTRDPRLILQLGDQVELTDEIALLRVLPGPLHGWQERLARIPLRDRTGMALRLESWVMVQSLQSGQLTEQVADGPVMRSIMRPLFRHGIAEYVDQMDRALARLETEDLRSFGNDRFFEEELARIPRWNIVARLLAPNYFDVWAKAARTELGVDLTRRTIEARDLLRRGDLERLEELLGAHPSPVESIRWIYRIDPGELVIEASAEIPVSSTHPLPLEVRLTRH